MKKDFKPMLAGKAPEMDVLIHPHKFTWPRLVSPKLDGIRAVIIDGQVLSRNLIPFPCPTVQEYFGRADFNGFDGELIVGSPTAPDAFRITSSFVMSNSPIDFMTTPLVFHVFDDFTRDASPFESRFMGLGKRIRKASRHLKIVPHERVINHHGLDVYEELWVKEGYEGLMMRDPHAPYKFGRSTTKEAGLLKVKRFEDNEAVVIGYKELQHNENDERTGGLAQRRSSKKAGKVGGGTLGALCVRRGDGVEFDVGTGFDAAERAALWAIRDTLLGKHLKYRFFAGGSKSKPRFPTYLGFRDPIDL